MKKLPALFTLLILVGIVTITGSGCKKLLGLEKQKDWHFEPVTLDPHVHMDAWSYLKLRSQGPTQDDSILHLFYEGIRYAGIDSALYKTQDRTFIFLHNDAILRLSGDLVASDCYFGMHLTAAGIPGQAWTDYPKDSVRNWLLYLIADGQHTFETLKPSNTEANTQLPKNVAHNNPDGLLDLRIDNTANYQLMINDFTGSLHIVTARTAGILADNGPIHVVDRVVDYNR
jgi:hypothetical protein